MVFLVVAVQVAEAKPKPGDLIDVSTVIPDAVIEIVSTGYEYKDVTLNPPFYLAQGVQDVVIHDPATLLVSHYTRIGMTQHTAPVQLGLGCGCDCAIPR